MKPLVLGVIGHVDHGKTALVRALTGMETDRLAEEKRRGISIALGFAHFAVSGAEVDLIDMPGHEQFVRTMVAGANGINAVLLVVAANEGIKPQTIEHINITQLLGIRHAVIAVSKADLVAPEQAAATARDAAALVTASGLSTPDPIAISAVTGQGLDALRSAIAQALQAAPAPEDDGFAWLPIDRSFSMAGHGTIVTGTLRHGNLSTGDQIAILPSGLPARVRGLQVHGAQVAGAGPGQRVAVNLRGVEPARAPRGAALAGEAVYAGLAASAWLSVALQAANGAPELRNGARLHLLAGTFEVEARLRLLDRDVLTGDDLAGGGFALAQLHCTKPVVLPAREPFILRSTSPPLTVAGGRVLEPETRRLRRRAPGGLAHLSALAGMNARQIVVREVERAGQGGTTLDSLARLAGLAPARAAEALQGQPIRIGRNRSVVGLPAFEALLHRLPGLLTELQAVYPDGVPLARLQAKLPDVGCATLNEALAQLAAAGMLHQAGGRVGLRHAAQEQSRARSDAALAARLTEALRRCGLRPPGTAEIAPDPQSRRMLERLIREGVIMRMTDHGQKRDVLFHRDAVEAARRQLGPLLASGPGLMVTEIGAALGVSRKFSVPLLEYLDAIHFTRRINDRRVLAQPAPSRTGL